jgi:hypothetical protein
MHPGSVQPLPGCFYLRGLTRLQLAGLVVIMLMAAGLRAAHLGLIEHNVDHAYPIWQALTTLDRGAWPLAGQGTSVLFANPPLTGYLFLPGLALTRSPISAYGLVIALNTLGLYLAFAVARRLVNTPVALLAAGLLAVNPWLIEYSRATWVQGLLPFFASALAWALWPALAGRSSKPGRRLILACVILALYTQTYLLAFLAVAPVGVLILLGWRRLPKTALGIGVGVFLCASIPYGLGLLQQAETVQSRLNDFSSAARQFRPESVAHALRLISGADYPVSRGMDAPIADSALRQALTQAAQGVMVVVAGGWLVVGLAWASRYRLAAFSQQPATAPDSAVIVILGVSWALPALLMLFTGQPVHPFYQIIGTPAGHIGLAWMLWGAARWLTGSAGRAGVVLAALFIPFAALMSVNSLRFAEETAATAGVDGLSALPLELGLQVGAAINTHLSEGGRVLADVDEWMLNSLSGRLYPVMRDARTGAVQIIPAAGGLLLRAGDAAFSPPPFAERAWAWSQAERGGTFHLALERYPAGITGALPIPAPLRVSGQEGLDLLGYGLAESGAEATLTTYWQVSATPPGIGVSLFVPFIHLYNAAGERVQIIDGQTVAGGDWRVGDVHIHRMTFRPPAVGGPFRLEIGQYDGVAGRNIIFLPDYVPTVRLPDGIQ